VALTIYEGMAPTVCESVLTNIDSEVYALEDKSDPSSDDSTHTFDTYSSDGDTGFGPCAVLMGSAVDQRAGEDDVITNRKKKGRSPSWGTNTSSVVRGNSACKNNSEGSMNKPQSRPSLRSLRHGARKSVTQPAPLKNPVPVRPSPLNGLIDTVGKAKLEKELCNVKGLAVSIGRRGKQQQRH
jgi:hypothetical protein